MRTPPRRTKLPDDDDGRTIAPMNVDGMPWHTPPPEPDAAGDAKPKAGRKPDPLPGRVLRRFMLSAVGAGLLITLLFCAVGALFIVFCTQVWFR